MYKYIVYKTTNKINNKIYIGVHKINTDKPDTYIGDGINKGRKTYKNYTFHRAVQKYG